MSTPFDEQRTNSAHENMSTALGKAQYAAWRCWSVGVLRNGIFGAFPGDSFKQEPRVQKADAAGLVNTSTRRSTMLEEIAHQRKATALGRMDNADPGRPDYDQIIQGDSVKALKSLPGSTFHLILSDIPYGIAADEWDVLHNNTNSALLGSSPAQKRAGAIFKTRGKPINGWSEADRAIPREYYEWCSSWASDWFRVLRPGGSVLIFAGRRLAHRCICALEDAGFSFKDLLAWKRPRAAHRAQRLSVIFERRGDAQSARQWQGWKVGNLRPVFEPILWFNKPYKIGTTIADNAVAQGVGPYNEDAFAAYAGRPDNVIECGFEAKEAGFHPTQKPVRLMQALIELTTRPGHLVLDPFAGSGATLIAARNLGRRYLGYESSEEFVKVCRNRLASDLFTIKT